MVRRACQNVYGGVVYGWFFMMMTNDNIRYFPHDRFMAQTVLKLIPRTLRPNHFTVARFVLTPFVLWFVWREVWSIALPLFIGTAFTDAIDGSLARTRKQITVWGTIADPIADKLLIAPIVILFVAREINPIFAAMIVGIELLIVASALYRKSKGKISGSNDFGKVKMILQVVGVGLLLFARVLHIDLAVNFAVGTLSLAMIFALASLVTYGL